MEEYILAREEQLSKAREKEEAKRRQEMVERVQGAAKEIEMFRERVRKMVYFLFSKFKFYLQFYKSHFDIKSNAAMTD